MDGMKAAPIAANDRACHDDTAYYLRREREERDRATACFDHTARAIHLALAAAYRRRLGAAWSADTVLALVCPTP